MPPPQSGMVCAQPKLDPPLLITPPLGEFPPPCHLALLSPIGSQAPPGLAPPKCAQLGSFFLGPFLGKPHKEPSPPSSRHLAPGDLNCLLS